MRSHPHSRQFQRTTLQRTVIPLIFGIAGFAVLISLGNWQLHRLEWKEAILSDINEKIAGEPVELPGLPNEEAHKYLSVAATGIFRQDALRILVSRREIGAGYLIVSPFETGGRAILVQRGFLKIEDELRPPSGGRTTVTGNLHWPDDRNGSTPENDIEGNLWFARDLAQMASAVNAEPVLLIARETTRPEPSLDMFPIDAADVPNDHLEYAVTWFLLAMVWAGMTAYYMYRVFRIRQGE